MSDTTANPAPLGLFGFGMTTILLNLHNTGLFPLDTMILGMGACYGGAAQVLAGLCEWKKGNTFATTAFTSYGFFWLSLVGLWVAPAQGLGNPPSDAAMAAYLGMWGFFTLVLFIGTLRLSRALQVVFGSLVLLFALLTAAKASGSHVLHTIAGWEGVFCGLAACYTGGAQVINEVYRRTVLPLGIMRTV